MTKVTKAVDYAFESQFSDVGDIFIYKIPITSETTIIGNPRTRPENLLNQNQGKGPANQEQDRPASHATPSDNELPQVHIRRRRQKRHIKPPVRKGINIPE